MKIVWEIGIIVQKDFSSIIIYYANYVVTHGGLGQY